MIYKFLLYENNFITYRIFYFFSYVIQRKKKVKSRRRMPWKILWAGKV